eukprot:384880_1
MPINIKGNNKQTNNCINNINRCMQGKVAYIVNLNVEKCKFDALKSNLFHVMSSTNDWRKNEPIQNIIDPDLYLYKSYVDGYKDAYFKSLQHKYDYICDPNNFNKKSESTDDSDTDSDNSDWRIRPDNHKWVFKENGISQNHWNETQKQLVKGYLVRGQYQWLATECCETNDSVTILSNIHNISPRSQYSDLYVGIEYILTKMLPLFNHFKVFQDRQKKEFQVIIKSQRYEIKDMTGYSGHWHQEGLTENIVLAGLYYFEKDEHLIGGNLKFRKDYMVSNTDTVADYDEYLEIDEGTAVVFDNVDMVHRVTMVKNKFYGKSRYRSFLAFFIVDPTQPIISTKDVSSLKRNDYISVISMCTDIQIYEILNLICEYGNCGYTLLQAQEMREKDIEVRANTLSKGRFGYVWGNNGEIFFLKMGKMNPWHHDDLVIDENGYLCGDFVDGTVSQFDSDLPNWTG